MAKKEFHVLGLMSGTSLDGLDMAWCRFSRSGDHWRFTIVKATTLAYLPAWKAKLSGAHQLEPQALLTLHAQYGHWLGRSCKRFIKQNNIRHLDCIASHGHTVFHQPLNQFTFQLGDGHAIHAETGVPLVYDFRSLDVQLGGQGAPLVPMGDKLLFSDYAVCLNIGGIANLSLEKNGKRKAFDICFANMGLNFLSEKIGQPYDADGGRASRGKINHTLLKQINAYYRPFKSNRPSLAREHFEQGLLRLLNTDSITLGDRLCTFTESIAIQIALAVPNKQNQKILITGGGAHNQFLLSRLAHHIQKKATLKIPDRQIIDFKEALVFAFLGVLRLQNKVNVLKSVTGASQDSSSGVVIGL
jgi:anhydro-N-acetylmuramic acid kinase